MQQLKCFKDGWKDTTKRLFQNISMCYERESKSGRTDAADRLSDLPDSLIIHILSFLRTKDAIRTGILSKRWRFLWTFVPTLSFHSGFHRSITKFRNFVERALILHHSSKLDNLLIEIPTFYTLTKPKQSLDDHINSCLRYAINRDVATLHLDFSYRIYMTGFPAQGSKRLLLPDFLYGHSSLTNLSTQMCDYAPRRRISWGLLRCLTIGLTELRDDVFSSILAGSPALEFLELHACWGFQVLDTGSSSLNKLKLTIDSLSLAAVKISAPNLKSLEILGPVSMNLELLNALALIDVDLSFTLSGDGVNGTFARDIVLQLLHNIRRANKVVLGASVCKILFNIDAIEFSLPFKHTCLVLQLHVKDLGHALANLLQNSPTLETLVINIYGIYVTELSSNHKKYWSSLEAGRFLCLKQTLKTVKITGFRAGIMPFLEFLLVNAKVMEKTSIYFMKVWSHKDAIEKSELVKMAQKLPPSIPRPSSNSKAVVEFHE